MLNIHFGCLVKQLLFVQVSIDAGIQGISLFNLIIIINLIISFDSVFQQTVEYYSSFLN